MLIFYGCRNVPRDSGEVYLVNQEDKIALCRESVLILGSDGVERDISGDLDDKVTTICSANCCYAPFLFPTGEKNLMKFSGIWSTSAATKIE